MACNPPSRYGHTAELADFAAGLRPGDLPTSVVDVLRRHVLDQIGVQLACTQLPWVRQSRGYATAYGAAGTSTVVGDVRTVDAEPAAFVNAVAGHGFEMDDYCSGTMAHPGCVTVPACLAVAEERAVDGATFLRAAAIGYELIIRLSLAMMPSMLQERGFHHTSVHGVVGAAGATASLLGLDGGETAMSLGIAASEAGGIAEYAESGGEVKRLHAGFASSGGIRATRLAAAGLSAPVTSLEGRRGFLQAFSPVPRPEALTDGLGDRWELVDRLQVKPYCCAGAIHPAIDAVHQLMDEHDLGAGDIEAVAVGASRHSLVHIGTIGPEPADLSSAQFSLHYSLALTVVRRSNDFKAYVDAAAGGFGDPDVLSMARRITMYFDDEVESEMANGYLGKVAMTLKGGKVLRLRTFAKGSKQRPLTELEVAEKFEANAGMVLPRETVAELRRSITGLDGLVAMRDVGEMLRAQNPTSLSENPLSV